MRSRLLAPLAIALVAAAASGCDTGRSLTDWLDFTGTKTKIQGERIPIIASQAELAADPQTAAVKMELPPPKKNMEWPLPGGSAENMTGNLQADGPLEQMWSVSAGKGSDDDCRLKRPLIRKARIKVRQEKEQ